MVQRVKGYVACKTCWAQQWHKKEDESQFSSKQDA